MQKHNYHNGRRMIANQMVGQISLRPIENNPDPQPTISDPVPVPQASPGYNLVPQSDVPVPPGFKLVPLSELHGTQAPPPGYKLLKL